MCAVGVIAALLFLSSPQPERPDATVITPPTRRCTEVASLIARVPSLQLTAVTSSTEPHFCVTPGAAVAMFSGRGSMEAFSGRTPDDLLHEALAKSGWIQCLNCSADGPDGTVWALGRDGAVVIVEGRWDGGDDTEPDAPVSDEYQIIVRCVDGVQCERAPVEPEPPPSTPRTGAISK